MPLNGLLWRTGAGDWVEIGDRPLLLPGESNSRSKVSSILSVVLVGVAGKAEVEVVVVGFKKKSKSNATDGSVKLSLTDEDELTLAGDDHR